MSKRDDVESCLYCILRLLLASHEIHELPWQYKETNIGVETAQKSRQVEKADVNFMISKKSDLTKHSSLLDFILKNNQSLNKLDKGSIEIKKVFM